MTSRRKFSILGTLVVGVISLLLIALPGTAAARNHHQRHHGHHGQRHHGQRRHHGHQRHHQTGTTSDDNAGTIASFDGTTLVITLTDGSSASGLVTDATEIKCESNSGDTGDDDGDNGDTGDDDNGDTGDDDTGGGGGDDGAAVARTHRAASDQGTSDDDDNGDNDDNDDGDTGEGQCTTADLTPGTVVQDAELSDVNGQATFTEIDLVK